MPDKPNGLWYGFGDSWLNWQNYEPEGKVTLDKYYYLYEIKIPLEKICSMFDGPAPNKVLSIKSINESRMFYDAYSTTAKELVGLPKGLGLDFGSYIDWKRVANDYAGIEIPALDDEYRFDHHNDTDYSWSYSWDVPSGCVWNVESVQFWPFIPSPNH